MSTEIYDSIRRKASLATGPEGLPQSRTDLRAAQWNRLLGRVGKSETAYASLESKLYESELYAIWSNLVPQINKAIDDCPLDICRHASFGLLAKNLPTHNENIAKLTIAKEISGVALEATVAPLLNDLEPLYNVLVHASAGAISTKHELRNLEQTIPALEMLLKNNEVKQWRNEIWPRLQDHDDMMLKKVLMIQSWWLEWHTTGKYYHGEGNVKYIDAEPGQTLTSIFERGLGTYSRRYVTRLMDLRRDHRKAGGTKKDPNLGSPIQEQQYNISKLYIKDDGSMNWMASRAFIHIISPKTDMVALRDFYLDEAVQRYLWNSWTDYDEAHQDLLDASRFNQRLETTWQYLESILVEINQLLIHLTQKSLSPGVDRCFNAIEDTVLNATTGALLPLRDSAADLHGALNDLQTQSKAMESELRPWVDDPEWVGRATLGKDSLPPTFDDIVCGISLLEVNRDYNLDVKCHHSPEIGVSPKWRSSEPLGFEIDWMQLPNRGKGMDWGTVSTQDDPFTYVEDRDIKRRTFKIEFKSEATEAFKADGGQPEVVVWIKGIHLDVQFNYRFNVTAHNITSSSFELQMETWWDTIAYELQAGWLAFPATSKELFCARATFSRKQYLSLDRESCHPQPISFNDKFLFPPRVASFIQRIDIDQKAATRLDANVQKLERNRARLHVDGWDDTHIWIVDGVYLFRGIPKPENL